MYVVGTLIIDYWEEVGGGGVGGGCILIIDIVRSRSRDWTITSRVNGYEVASIYVISTMAHTSKIQIEATFFTRHDQTTKYCTTNHQRTKQLSFSMHCKFEKVRSGKNCTSSKKIMATLEGGVQNIWELSSRWAKVWGCVERGAGQMCCELAVAIASMPRRNITIQDMPVYFVSKCWV